MFFYFLIQPFFTDCNDTCLTLATLRESLFSYIMIYLGEFMANLLVQPASFISLFRISLVAFFSLGILHSTDANAANPICVNCLKVRVSAPSIVRGPFIDELDNPISTIKTQSGEFRMFTANGNSFSVDGSVSYAFGGARTLVLAKGAKGSDAECGRWINSTQLIGNILHGFVHQERACNYSISQTHKSMSYFISRDEGLTWEEQGKIISGTDTPTAGKNTGEGDCTSVDGHDGYFYLYCRRHTDWKTIVARAPQSDMKPGTWKKLYNGSFSQPGLGGESTALGALGQASAYLSSLQQILLVGFYNAFGGAKLSFSPDGVNFQTLEEPLIVADQPSDWSRESGTELFGYASMQDRLGGGNTLNEGGAFRFSHTYMEPGPSSNRYLVMRNVYVTATTSPIDAQVGVAFTRWRESATGILRSTMAPVVGNFGRYTVDKTLGYLMTKAPANAGSIKLQECYSNWPGHDDFLVTGDNGTACINDAAYKRVRTAGWVYATAQPNTVPLYRCYNSVEKYHFVSNTSTCDGLGNKEWLLGYAMEQ